MRIGGCVNRRARRRAGEDEGAQRWAGIEGLHKLCNAAQFEQGADARVAQVEQSGRGRNGRWPLKRAVLMAIY